MTALTKESLPADIRDTYDYIIEQDVMGDSWATDNIRRVARRCTLGEALEAASKEHPDVKLLIRMPVPREPPWKEFPALMVGGKPPPGAFVKMQDKQIANVLQLLRLLGYRTGAEAPLSGCGAGGAWLTSLGLELEKRRENEVDPDFTAEDLALAWRQSTAGEVGWEAEVKAMRHLLWRMGITAELDSAAFPSVKAAEAIKKALR